ncbi:MAG: hypothetical protein JWQ20_3860 [Conexibacter sp.]|nr:hypothetical protein [Conexibacter sp.]
MKPRSAAAATPGASVKNARPNPSARAVFGAARARLLSGRR